MDTFIQLIHPSVMLGFFTYFLYTGYLGWQVRQTRNAEGERKKELVKARFNSRHHNLGAIALSIMILGALGGMGVTYWFYKKLYVDAHLLVGLAMTGMIAITASLTPYMQKGHIWARNLHIALNAGLVGFFGWQAVTGFGIVQQILFPA
ncbi:DUF4079 domain-containing protein [Nostoc parmelioides FACHB-3921]|uniref:DUF4079 domain-containing protein n=1 Tax=Nostoc parmelioides FACHB-3921 TaxID=2692909 RepID=A0ABR8BR97_9NOSO|nr:DUF4079 domain-containing protein [Nostoc parmelioides]MBD2255430.1 DUF4079 domain-containing protein [Nostoc parmelioides FACHB-3921]